MSETTELPPVDNEPELPPEVINQMTAAKVGLVTWMIIGEAIKMDQKKGTDLTSAILSKTGSIIGQYLPSDPVGLIIAAKMFVYFHHGIKDAPGFVQQGDLSLNEQFKKRQYPWSVQL